MVKTSAKVGKKDRKPGTFSMQYSDIVTAMGYDRSTVFRNHKKALKEVDEVFKMRPHATRQRG